MMTSSPKISIVIPCYNAVHTLPRSLRGVLEQDYPSLELIVLDAGSTDGTVAIIESFAEHISHWRSHRDDGPNAAYNEGIEKASGEIVALLNADDWYEPGLLQKVGDIFAANPDVDMVTCAARMVTVDDGGAIAEQKRFEGKQLALAATASPIPNARFYRKRIFERYGLFKTHNHRGERFIAADLDMLLRLSAPPTTSPASGGGGGGALNVTLPEVGYNYRVHAGSITFSGNPANNRRMYDERAWLAELYLGERSWNAKERRRLKRWHRRGTARLCYYHLRERQWRSAWAEMKRGMTVNPLIWPVDMLRLLVVSLFRKLDV